MGHGGQGSGKLSQVSVALRACLSVLLLMIFTQTHAVESTCYGTYSNGRLENAVSLQEDGKNFSAYSTLGVKLGRTYVHSRVAEIVEETYRVLEKSAPNKLYVYGETGWAAGGRIRPHRTHRNGLSVDFMVPVLDASGQSVPLPGSAGNQFGYAIDFDADGKYGGYSIDFSAMAEHLYQLHLIAKQHGADISLVILDPPYIAKLLSAGHGEYLKQNIRFMKGKVWVRHDEHYHVNFAIPCEPMK